MFTGIYTFQASRSFTMHSNFHICTMQLCTQTWFYENWKLNTGNNNLMDIVLVGLDWSGLAIPWTICKQKLLHSQYTFYRIHIIHVRRGGVSPDNPPLNLRRNPPWSSDGFILATLELWNVLSLKKEQESFSQISKNRVYTRQNGLSARTPSST